MAGHDGCAGCRYFEKYKKIAVTTSEMPCYDCESAHKRKMLTDKYEPMTNADRIRAMSDEELADFIGCIFDNLLDTSIGVIDFPCEHCTGKINCDVCFLEWLEEKARGSEEE